MDLRQEMEHIFRNGYDWYQRNLGEAIVWHEYDSANSAYHGTYDEGGRHYTAGYYVPSLWVIISEDRATRTNEGRKPTEKISLAISARSMDMSGVSDPEDYTRHLNDVVRYDERLWKLTEYNIRGRIPTEVIIGISGTQIYRDEEMTFDALPPGMDLAGNHRSLPYPNETDEGFAFHDGPNEFVSLYRDTDTNIVIDGGTASLYQDTDTNTAIDGGTAQ